MGQVAAVMKCGQSELSDWREWLDAGAFGLNTRLLGQLLTGSDFAKALTMKRHGKALVNALDLGRFLGGRIPLGLTWHAAFMYQCQCTEYCIHHPLDSPTDSTMTIEVSH